LNGFKRKLDLHLRDTMKYKRLAFFPYTSECYILIAGASTLFI